MSQATSILVSTKRGSRLHLEASPWDAAISTRSAFSDNVWYIDITTPGQNPATARLSWDFEIEPGLTFDQARFATLRDGFKRFVWSLLADRRSGLELTAGSMGPLGTGIRSLVGWMVRNDYDCFSQLDSAASQEYLEDVVESYLAEVIAASGVDADVDDALDDSEIPHGLIRPRANLWALLWTQRAVMREAGVATLPEAPFDGKSAKSMTNLLTTKVAGWIQPVPDEVALPVMAEANRWLWNRADDIIRLQQQYIAAWRPELCGDYMGLVAKGAIDDFAFSCDPSTNMPWRQPMTGGGRFTLFRRQWRQAHLDTHSVLRTLIEDLCAACVIVVQSEAGPRINEMCGLTAGWSTDGAGGQSTFPSCIERRGSKTGLNEHFFLKGVVSKLRRAPEKVEWMLGARPVDSDIIPAPVRAVYVLQSLFEPLRGLANDKSLRDDLIVQLTAPRGYPRDGEEIGKIMTAMLRKWQRQFIGNHVDLSDLPDRNAQGQDLAKYRDSKGACLLTHSWRKSYALYVFRTDPRMIPAIAQQFHHLSLAMTEQGYLGSDPSLLEVMDGVRVQQTAEFFYQLARGERKVSGRMAKLVDDFREEFARVLGTAHGLAGTEVMRKWVLDEDIRIWFARHGKCFMGLAPTKAKCHEAGKTAHWSNTEPNYAYRNPETCLGCPLYAVDGEHTEFWLLRYVENSRFAITHAPARSVRAAELRARQSAAVLNALGVSLPPLEVSRD